MSLTKLPPKKQLPRKPPPQISTGMNGNNNGTFYRHTERKVVSRPKKQTFKSKTPSLNNKNNNDNYFVTFQQSVSTTHITWDPNKVKHNNNNTNNNNNNNNNSNGNGIINRNKIKKKSTRFAQTPGVSRFKPNSNNKFSTIHAISENTTHDSSMSNEYMNELAKNEGTKSPTSPSKRRPQSARRDNRSKSYAPTSLSKEKMKRFPKKSLPSKPLPQKPLPNNNPIVKGLKISNDEPVLAAASPLTPLTKKAFDDDIEPEMPDTGMNGNGYESKIKVRARKKKKIKSRTQPSTPQDSPTNPENITWKNNPPPPIKPRTYTVDATAFKSFEAKSKLNTSNVSTNPNVSKVRTQTLGTYQTSRKNRNINGDMKRNNIPNNNDSRELEVIRDEDVTDYSNVYKNQNGGHNGGYPNYSNFNMQKFGKNSSQSVRVFNNYTPQPHTNNPINMNNGNGNINPNHYKLDSNTFPHHLLRQYQLQQQNGMYSKPRSQKAKSVTFKNRQNLLDPQQNNYNVNGNPSQFSFPNNDVNNFQNNDEYNLLQSSIDPIKTPSISLGPDDNNDDINDDINDNDDDTSTIPPPPPNEPIPEDIVNKYHHIKSQKSHTDMTHNISPTKVLLYKNKRKKSANVVRNKPQSKKKKIRRHFKKPNNKRSESKQSVASSTYSKDDMDMVMYKTGNKYNGFGYNNNSNNNNDNNIHNISNLQRINSYNAYEIDLDNKELLYDKLYEDLGLNSIEYLFDENHLIMAGLKKRSHIIKPLNDKILFHNDSDNDNNKKKKKQKKKLKKKGEWMEWSKDQVSDWILELCNENHKYYNYLKQYALKFYSNEVEGKDFVNLRLMEIKFIGVNNLKHAKFIYKHIQLLINPKKAKKTRSFRLL